MTKYALEIKHLNKTYRNGVIALKDINHVTFWLWAVSSVGRASRLHRGGHRFESYTAHQESKVGV